MGKGIRREKKGGRGSRMWKILWRSERDKKESSENMVRGYERNMEWREGR